MSSHEECLCSCYAAPAMVAWKLAARDAGFRVGDLCKQQKKHPRWLQRQFRAAFGDSPKRLLARWRLECTIEELTTSSASREFGTRTSLKELAFAMGYFDASHMSRDFRRQYGMSPKEYLARNPSNPVARSDDRAASDRRR